MDAIRRLRYKKTLKKASFTNVNRIPSLYSIPPHTHLPLPSIATSTNKTTNTILCLHLDHMHFHFSSRSVLR